MKKIISAILALAMLLGCGALAESMEKEYMATISMNGVFELRCAIPEGYKLETLTQDENVSQQLFVIRTEQKDLPDMFLSIAFDEMYADVERLNDMSEEDKAALLATWSEEDKVEYSIVMTDYGTELFLIREVEGTTDFATFFTIYKGYEIEFLLASPNGTNGLTEEQIRKALKFLSDLDFVEPEAK